MNRIYLDACIIIYIVEKHPIYSNKIENLLTKLCKFKSGFIMKNIKSKFVLAFILIIISVSINAQTMNNNDSQISIDKENLIWTKFDSKNNETIVSTYSIIVYSKPYYASSYDGKYDENSFFCFHETLLFTAGFYYKGKSLTDVPDKIEFVIKSNMVKNSKFKKQKERMLKVRTDKTKLDFGEMKLISSNIKENPVTVHGSGLKSDAKLLSCSYIEEEIAIHIPTKTFKEIVRSDKVEIKIGEFYIKLKKTDIKVFENLVEHLQTVNSNPKI